MADVSRQANNSTNAVRRLSDSNAAGHSVNEVGACKPDAPNAAASLAGNEDNHPQNNPNVSTNDAAGVMLLLMGAKEEKQRDRENDDHTSALLYADLRRESEAEGGAITTTATTTTAASHAVDREAGVRALETRIAQLEAQQRLLMEHVRTLLEDKQRRDSVSGHRSGGSKSVSGAEEGHEQREDNDWPDLLFFHTETEKWPFTESEGGRSRKKTWIAASDGVVTQQIRASSNSNSKSNSNSNDNTNNNKVSSSGRCRRSSSVSPSKTPTPPNNVHHHTPLRAPSCGNAGCPSAVDVANSKWREASAVSGGSGSINGGGILTSQGSGSATNLNTNTNNNNINNNNNTSAVVTVVAAGEATAAAAAAADASLPAGSPQPLPPPYQPHHHHSSFSSSALQVTSSNNDRDAGPAAATTAGGTVAAAAAAAHNTTPNAPGSTGLATSNSSVRLTTTGRQRQASQVTLISPTHAAQLERDAVSYAHDGTNMNSHDNNNNNISAGEAGASNPILSTSLTSGVSPAPGGAAGTAMNGGSAAGLMAPTPLLLASHVGDTSSSGISTHSTSPTPTTTPVERTTTGRSGFTNSNNNTNNNNNNDDEDANDQRTPISSGAAGVSGNHHPLSVATPGLKASSPILTLSVSTAALTDGLFLPATAVRVPEQNLPPPQPQSHHHQHNNNNTSVGNTTNNNNNSSSSNCGDQSKLSSLGAAPLPFGGHHFHASHYTSSSASLSAHGEGATQAAISPPHQPAQSANGMSSNVTPSSTSPDQPSDQLSETRNNNSNNVHHNSTTSATGAVAVMSSRATRTHSSCNSSSSQLLGSAPRRDKERATPGRAPSTYTMFDVLPDPRAHPSHQRHLHSHTSYPGSVTSSNNNNYNNKYNSSSNSYHSISHARERMSSFRTAKPREGDKLDDLLKECAASTTSTVSPANSHVAVAVASAAAAAAASSTSAATTRARLHNNNNKSSNSSTSALFTGTANPASVAPAVALPEVTKTRSFSEGGSLVEEFRRLSSNTHLQPSDGGGSSSIRNDEKNHDKGDNDAPQTASAKLSAGSHVNASSMTSASSNAHPSPPALPRMPRAPSPNYTTTLNNSSKTNNNNNSSGSTRRTASFAAGLDSSTVVTEIFQDVLKLGHRQSLMENFSHKLLEGMIEQRDKRRRMQRGVAGDIRRLFRLYERLRRQMLSSSGSFDFEDDDGDDDNNNDNDASGEADAEEDERDDRGGGGDDDGSGSHDISGGESHAHRRGSSSQSTPAASRRRTTAMGGDSTDGTVTSHSRHGGSGSFGSYGPRSGRQHHHACCPRRRRVKGFRCCSNSNSNAGSFRWANTSSTSCGYSAYRRDESDSTTAAPQQQEEQLSNLLDRAQAANCEAQRSHSDSTEAPSHNSTHNHQGEEGVGKGTQNVLLTPQTETPVETKERDAPAAKDTSGEMEDTDGGTEGESEEKVKLSSGSVQSGQLDPVTATSLTFTPALGPMGMSGRMSTGGIMLPCVFATRDANPSPPPPPPQLLSASPSITANTTFTTTTTILATSGQPVDPASSSRRGKSAAAATKAIDHEQQQPKQQLNGQLKSTKSDTTTNTNNATVLQMHIKNNNNTTNSNLYLLSSGEASVSLNSFGQPTAVHPPFMPSLALPSSVANANANAKAAARVAAGGAFIVLDGVSESPSALLLTPAPSTPVEAPPDSVQKPAAVVLNFAEKLDDVQQQKEQQLLLKRDEGCEGAAGDLGDCVSVSTQSTATTTTADVAGGPAESENGAASDAKRGSATAARAKRTSQEKTAKAKEDVDEDEAASEDVKTACISAEPRVGRRATSTNNNNNNTTSSTRSPAKVSPLHPSHLSSASTSSSSGRRRRRVVGHKTSTVMVTNVNIPYPAWDTAATRRPPLPPPIQTAAGQPNPPSSLPSPARSPAVLNAAGVATVHPSSSSSSSAATTTAGIFTTAAAASPPLKAATVATTTLPSPKSARAKRSPSSSQSARPSLSPGLRATNAHAAHPSLRRGLASSSPRTTPSATPPKSAAAPRTSTSLGGNVVGGTGKPDVEATLKESLVSPSLTATSSLTHTPHAATTVSARRLYEALQSSKETKSPALRGSEHASSSVSSSTSPVVGTATAIAEAATPKVEAAEHLRSAACTHATPPQPHPQQPPSSPSPSILTQKPHTITSCAGSNFSVASSPDAAAAVAARSAKAMHARVVSSAMCATELPSCRLAPSVALTSQVSLTSSSAAAAAAAHLISTRDSQRERYSSSSGNSNSAPSPTAHAAGLVTNMPSEETARQAAAAVFAAVARTASSSKQLQTSAVHNTNKSSSASVLHPLFSGAPLLRSPYVISPKSARAARKSSSRSSVPVNNNNNNNSDNKNTTARITSISNLLSPKAAAAAAAAAVSPAVVAGRHAPRRGRRTHSLRGRELAHKSPHVSPSHRSAGGATDRMNNNNNKKNISSSVKDLAATSPTKTSTAAVPAVDAGGMQSVGGAPGGTLASPMTVSRTKMFVSDGRASGTDSSTSTATAAIVAAGKEEETQAQIPTIVVSTPPELQLQDTCCRNPDGAEAKKTVEQVAEVSAEKCEVVQKERSESSLPERTATTATLTSSDPAVTDEAQSQNDADTALAANAAAALSSCKVDEQQTLLCDTRSDKRTAVKNRNSSSPRASPMASLNKVGDGCGAQTASNTTNTTTTFTSMTNTKSATVEASEVHPRTPPHGAPSTSVSRDRRPRAALAPPPLSVATLSDASLSMLHSTSMLTTDDTRTNTNTTHHASAAQPGDMLHKGVGAAANLKGQRTALMNAQLPQPRAPRTLAHETRRAKDSQEENSPSQSGYGEGESGLPQVAEQGGEDADQMGNSSYRHHHYHHQQPHYNSDERAHAGEGYTVEGDTNSHSLLASDEEKSANRPHQPFKYSTENYPRQPQHQPCPRPPPAQLHQALQGINRSHSCNTNPASYPFNDLADFQDEPAKAAVTTAAATTTSAGDALVPAEAVAAHANSADRPSGQDGRRVQKGPAPPPLDRLAIAPTCLSCEGDAAAQIGRVGAVEEKAEASTDEDAVYEMASDRRVSSANTAHYYAGAFGSSSRASPDMSDNDALASRQEDEEREGREENAYDEQVCLHGRRAAGFAKTTQDRARHGRTGSSCAYTNSEEEAVEEECSGSGASTADDLDDDVDDCMDPPPATSSFLFDATTPVSVLSNNARKRRALQQQQQQQQQLQNQQKTQMQMHPLCRPQRPHTRRAPSTAQRKASLNALRRASVSSLPLQRLSLQNSPVVVNSSASTSSPE